MNPWLVLLLTAQTLAATESWELNIRTAPTMDAVPGRQSPPAAFSSTASVRDLARQYIYEYRNEEKLALLEQLGRTEPRTLEDLNWLANLYERNNPTERLPVEQSLSRLSTLRPEFASFFVEQLKDKDPILQNFGILGALQLRIPEALPLLHKIASSRFRHPEPTFLLGPLEINRWNAQFRALRALTLWEGRKALPLLLKKSKEAPRVAGLIASFFWEEALPDILRWSQSNKEVDASRAKAAWTADVPIDALRRSSATLRQVLLDKRKSLSIRHPAAIKLGVSLNAEGVERLLEDHAQAKDEDLRLLLRVALFASRDQRVIPLLVEYVKTHPTPTHRYGALMQLKEMMKREDYRALLHWMAEHEKDQENREHVERELAALESLKDFPAASPR